MIARIDTKEILKIFQKYRFVQGMLGFEDIHEYQLLPVKGANAFFQLIAGDINNTSFVLTDPFATFKDYGLELSETEKNELEISNPQQVLILTTVTIPEQEVSRSTTNLAAPIIFNTEKTLAKQVIIEGWPVKKFLFERE